MVAPTAGHDATKLGTYAATTLGHRKPGDFVNLETDILAKYVQKLLATRFDRASPTESPSHTL